MANSITVTKNTTSGSERWDIGYTVDASGTVTKTLNTAGTLLDRNVKVSITTAAATFTVDGASVKTTSSGAGYVAASTTVGTVSSMTLPTAASSSSSGTSKATINTSTSAQYLNIPTGYNGTASYYTIRPVTTANISAGNIKTGVTIKVGDAGDDDRIAGVAGTFTASNTVSSGQTAAAAAQILSGYSAWVNGAEVQGSIATMTLPTSAASSATNGYTSKATISRSTSDQYINIPPGYNSAGAYYKFSAVANMTLPTSASSSSSGTSKATITPSTSDQYINIPTGYNGTASYYKISAMSTMTLPTSAAASATSGFTSKATISPSTSDQYINIPTGYNSAGAYYKISAMTTMTLPTATASSAATGSTLKATVSRSTSDQYINIPVGYNSAAGHYKISAVANGSVTAPSSISGSSASVSTGTNTITLSKTISVTPNVTTAGYISSGTAGNSSVSLTASVTTKAAATYTPTTTDQSIAASTYLTGAQTIKGDANLVADNIKSGVTIFGVSGTYVGTQVTITDETDTGGGTIRYINYTTDASNEYPWLGFGATYLGTEEWDVGLSATSYDSWTASTSATQILAAATTNDFSYTYNRDTESLIFITNATTKYSFISGATLKIIPYVTNRTDITMTLGAPSSLAQHQSNTIGTQTYWTTGSLTRTYYYNSNGAAALNASTVYGIYSYTNPTLSLTLSGTTVTAGYRRAAIYARCNSSIFATARKTDIDTATTKIHYKVEVYKVPKVNNLWTKGFDTMCEALNA